MHQRQQHFASVAALAMVASMAVNMPAAESGRPDFTTGDSKPERATHDWNLGPTGARGWMVSSKMETSAARQIYQEIEPLLPAIYQAVVEPAPSGIMFADGIRLSGLEILAKHRIQEGLPLCISLIDPNRWGVRNRIKRCLKILRVYV